MKSTAIPNRSKTIILTIPKVKVRKPFSLMEKCMRDLRVYNRNGFKNWNVNDN